MKTFKTYLASSLLAAAGLAMTACSDTNDWDTNGAFSRLFGVSSGKISVTAEDTYATVEFQGVPDAQYYLVEVSTDSLSNDIPLNGTAHSKVFGEDKSITTGKQVVISQLAGDQKYYLRIRAIADGLKESHWSYYKDGSPFKTKAEQIFTEVTDADRFEDHINVTWTPGAEVTNIVVSANGEEVMNIEPTDEQKAKGSLSITGLKPSTNYTIVIYNGEAKRGTLVTSTTAAMPAGDYKTLLPAMLTVLDQTTINELVNKGKAATGKETFSITVGIPAGISLDVYGIDEETQEKTSISIPEGVSVTFFGMPGGSTPTMNFAKVFNIKGGHSYLRFENISFTDGGSQYFINQSAECNVTELSFKQCRFSNFERSLVRSQGSAIITIGTLIVDDCVLTDMSNGNGYSVFYFGTGTTKVGKLSITNSTFNTTQRSFIEASKADIPNGVTIDHCTLYNCIEDGRYLVDAKEKNTPISLSNSIFGKTHSETARGARTASTITVENCLRASDCMFTSNDIANLVPDSRTSAEIFANPEGGDFTLKISERLGDPRWYPTE